MDGIRKITFGFAVVLGFVTLLNYIPGLTDAQGRTFGIFKLNLFNDFLHGGSTLWAASAAWLSRRAALAFLQIFGVLYFLDGAMGVAIGSGFLDLGVFINGVLNQPLGFKILASLPHLVLGGAAAFAGFVLSKRM
jgi:hypothetical protein